MTTIWTAAELKRASAVCAAEVERLRAQGTPERELEARRMALDTLRRLLAEAEAREACARA